MPKPNPGFQRTKPPLPIVVAERIFDAVEELRSELEGIAEVRLNGLKLVIKPLHEVDDDEN